MTLSPTCGRRPRMHHVAAPPARCLLSWTPPRAAIDFAAINRAALPHLETLCHRWLPGGKRIGKEWTCGSLRGEAGASCKVNIRTGRWCDFATGDRGGDVVSLAAAIHRIGQGEAARKLAEMLGIEVEGGNRG